MRQTYLYLIPLLCLVTSCLEEVDVDFQHPQQVVVNCILQPADVQTLSLTYSRALDESYFKEVEKADITLFSNGQQIGKFQKVGYGKWELQHRPVEEAKYQIGRAHV